MAVAAFVYAATFFAFGISAAERRFYLSKVFEADHAHARAAAAGVGERMRAVILAAGRGGRLRDVTGDRPKCLAQIGGVHAARAADARRFAAAAVTRSPS